MVDGPGRNTDIEGEIGAGIHSREIEREVSVAEVMNKAVIVMDINSDIPAIAREMVNRDAGSVVITENGKAMGIITERDLAKNVIAEDKRPSEVKASEILSSPLITIKPNASVMEASEVMLKANIKRLPVLENDMVIGVISNTDILMVAPGLSTILKELIDMNREALLSIPSIEEISETEDFQTGICESCNVFSYDLRFVDGRYLCGNCRQEEGEDYE
ncbi:MAG: CBS domain-containing protein [Methanosarcina sp.]|jgi:signal-transduction protein with cAMP-binding, CBS, and nucleotidyltransferase domain